MEIPVTQTCILQQGRCPHGTLFRGSSATETPLRRLWTTGSGIFREKWEVLVDDRGDLNGDATSVIPIVCVFTHFLRIGSSPSASKKKLLLEHTWLAPFLLDMFVDGGC